MVEYLAAPLVEQIVVEYLNAKLTEPVATEVPNPRPEAFARVILTGGAGRTGLVTHRASVTVESWGQTAYGAATLARLVEAYMLSLPLEVGNVYSVAAFAAPSNLPDPTSGQDRYTATYEIAVRAVAL